MKRCCWVSDNDSTMIDYHDNEYGKMITDNKLLFELLTLELMQTGLSWKIVLDKRDAFRVRFMNYELNDLIKMTDVDIIELYEAKDIIRNKMKINAVINNAKNIVEKDINLHKYIIDNFSKYQSDYKKCAKQYKDDGFKFIGPSVIESLHKALGLEEGHEKECFRYGNVI
ncbi:DNA-3-methyladenine glycosylase I [Bacilli bacterium PM5-3]|nr:DNA-3-methyladenine glycosylase I [Bacilli bacterium PM5-3]MDH6603268.1 DNA-3-methyladenine glycosylase I [Bacilli bacterium PM5-9]